jgi:hypothetical protein
MIVKSYDYPWKHLVIDNFLEPDAFTFIESYVHTNYDLYNLKRPVLEVHAQKSNSQLYQLLAPVILDMRNKYYDELNFANKLLPSTLYPFVELAICHPGFRYQRIHTDDKNFKCMTTILYISPEDGDGTELYIDDKKDSMAKQLEWKKNRALTFVGSQNPDFQPTWHNYGNTKLHGRASINMILSSTANGKY